MEMESHLWSKWSRLATLTEHELMLEASRSNTEAYNGGTYAATLGYIAIMRSAGLPILRVRMPHNGEILLILFELGIAPHASEPACPYGVVAEEEEIPEDARIVANSAGDISGGELWRAVLV
jgi:hypothetical protein